MTLLSDVRQEEVFDFGDLVLNWEKAQRVRGWRSRRPRAPELLELSLVFAAYRHW